MPGTKGKSGRKPKPTAMKRLEGNPGKRPLNDNEPNFKGTTTCPAWLLPDARTEWRRVCGQLQDIGLLTPQDRTVLASYCQAYARWKEAERHLVEEGSVYISSKGDPKQSPWSRISIQQQQLMVKAASEFGMTPSSRSRISVGTGADSDSDTGEDLLS